MARDATSVAFLSQRRWRAELGRRIPAGHQPDAGAYARTRPWWGRRHWIEQILGPTVAQASRSVFYERAARETVIRALTAMAGYADGATGRECRPTNERLAAELGVCVRTVQRCRAIGKELGLVVEVVAGRSCMTLAQRLVAHGRGSSHRAIAAEFALTVPSLWITRAAGPRALRDVTPPIGSSGSRESLVKPGIFTSERPREERLRRTHSRRTEPATAAGDLRIRRLIAGVQRDVPWLRGVAPRRLTPLVRFAREGWSERDVVRAIREVLARRDARVPERVEHPAAYLAWLLRDLDAADRPGALEQQQRRDELVAQAWEHHVNLGGAVECPHGEPAGDQPHPITGVRSCPFCRRELELDATRRAWPGAT